MLAIKLCWWNEKSGGWVARSGELDVNRWFGVNGDCCEIIAENGMLVANEDVWKGVVFPHVAWINGGACGKVNMSPALSTIGEAILLKIVADCLLCDEAFYTDAVAGVSVL